MKNKSLPLITMALLSIVLGYSFSLNNTSLLTAASNTSQIVNNSNIPAKLTLLKTINLNPVSKSDIQNYYQGLNALPQSELHGENLLKNLKGILRPHSTYITYAQVWGAYCITDRNWERSKPENISPNAGTYNSSTNCIENYVHDGSKTSVDKDNPYLHVYYRNDNDTHDVIIFDSANEPNGGHNQNANGINREHMWPKGHGFSCEYSPAYTDLHHLFCAAGYANNIHSNKYFGNVKPGSETYVDQTLYPGEGENCSGPSAYDNNISCFMPRKEDRGDIARAMFYMCARYNNYANDTNVILLSEHAVNCRKEADIKTENGLREPFLKLSDPTKDVEQKSVFSPNETTPIYYGILQDLLKWHKEDPVDAYEIHRNDLIYRNYQNNRNPFIDYPSWVDAIWGDKKSVNPLTDTIYEDQSGTILPENPDPQEPGGSETPTEIKPQSVSLDKNNAELVIGESLKLNANVLPVDATNKNVSFVSNNPNVATVSNDGLVNALSEGETTITVTTESQNLTDQCVINVKKAASSGGEIISGSQVKTTVENIDDTPIDKAGFGSGSYLIGALAKNETTYYFDSTTLSGNNAYQGVNARSDTLGYFKFDNIGNNKYTISNMDNSTYVGWEKDAKIKPYDAQSAVTNNVFIDNVIWDMNYDFGSNIPLRYGKPDDKIFVPVNEASTASSTRGILFKDLAKLKTNLIFSCFTKGNFDNADYTGLYLYKVNYVYDVLLTKLANMTCEDMRNINYHNDLERLYTKLNLDEQKALKNEEIKCSNNQTYNALYAYNYAMDEYSKNNTKTMAINNLTMQNTAILYVIVSISLAGCAILGYALYRRKGTK